MQKITALFNQEKARIAYLTAGDGGINRTLAAALALIDGGINMLEIGVPFSDPIADGAIIQRASSRALQAETTLDDVLKLVVAIRKISAIPLILFSYFNPILALLHTSFFAAAKYAGVNGVLIVDCPIEESTLFHQACIEQEIAPIYVLTPATSLERVRKISGCGHGFLYYACRKGTTGLRNTLPEDFVEKIQAIKAIVRLPVVVGFGISGRPQAEKILEYADGVVVGSLFVKAMEEGLPPSGLTTLAQSIYPV